MSEISNAAEFQTCFKCNYRAVTAEKRCPRCAKPLQNAATIRLIGALLTGFELIISVVMGAVIFSTARVIVAPRNGSAWHASPDQTKLVFAILFSVLAFGLAASLTGICHLVSGRRHLMMLRLMLGFGLILWIVMELIAAVVT